MWIWNRQTPRRKERTHVADRTHDLLSKVWSPRSATWSGRNFAGRMHNLISRLSMSKHTRSKYRVPLNRKIRDCHHLPMLGSRTRDLNSLICAWSLCRCSFSGKLDLELLKRNMQLRIIIEPNRSIEKKKPMLGKRSSNWGSRQAQIETSNSVQRWSSSPVQRYIRADVWEIELATSCGESVNRSPFENRTCDSDLA
jgi:hypothetical protein